MKNVAIIGLGVWGKNLLREYSKLCSVSICCTKGNKKNLKWIKQNYPNVKHTKNFDEVLNDPTIDIVVIATPIKTHFRLASKALQSGKHVFLEKTIAENIIEAKKLISIAKEKNLTFFVGHIFLYHPVLKKIKEIIKKDPIIYARLNWMRLGAFEEDIVFDLVSHYISIILELFGEPNSLSVLDAKRNVTNCDMITIVLKFSKNRKCVIDVNRNTTFKKRSITLLTIKNSFVWDDDVLYKLNKKNRLFDIIFESNKTPSELECKEFHKSVNKKKKRLLKC